MNRSLLGFSIAAAPCILLCGVAKADVSNSDPAPAPTPIVTPCPADADLNGRVEPADVAFFVNQWLTDMAKSDGGIGTKSDVDKSGRLDPTDVSLFVKMWYETLQAGGCPGDMQLQQ